MGDYAPLSSVVVKALLDKGYDKRKNAGNEVERLVKEYAQKCDTSQIYKIINIMKDFIISSNPHCRKGGLIGIASISMGLGPKTIDQFVNDLVTPVLPCFNDQNANVRYYATEALCNISRISRNSILNFFHDIFAIIVQLSLEIDQNIKNATELLDHSMKDIITESLDFDIEAFIPVVREKCFLKAAPPYTQMMLISWISTLQNIPHIDLLPFLPQVFDGIFFILESKAPAEVKKATELVVTDFLTSIERRPADEIKFEEMINILIVHAQSHDALVQKVSMQFILTFLNMSKYKMLPYASGILQSIILCIAYSDPALTETKATAEHVNNRLIELVSCSDEADDNPLERIDVVSMMLVLQDKLFDKSASYKICVLRWILLLITKTPQQMHRFVDNLLNSFIQIFSDQSDEVVLLSLQIFSQMASSAFSDNEKVKESEPEISLKVGAYFAPFLKSLLRYMDAERKILKDRAPFIIRKLCVMLPAAEVYRSLSELLIKENNLPFATSMVETLSSILLTSSELYLLRHDLSNLETEEGCDLFVKLFRCWCHSAVATITLCLLSQCYEQASTLVHFLGKSDITTETLIELDKLIQMIESPIFSKLRLQLLYPSKNGALVETLYGILLIIPQTDAFHTLQSRLSCVPPLHVQSSSAGVKETKERRNKLPQRISFEELMSTFVSTQQRHHSFVSN